MLGEPRGDVDGHVGDGRAQGLADTRAIWPGRLQDWRAQGTGDCRIRGPKALEITGWTYIESLRQVAIWH